MIQVSRGQLSSGMAGFWCLNIVVSIWSFGLSRGSYLFPIDILRQASSTGDHWQLQSYNFLTQSPATKESISLPNISNKTQ